MKQIKKKIDKNENKKEFQPNLFLYLFHFVGSSFSYMDSATRGEHLNIKRNFLSSRLLP